MIATTSWNLRWKHGRPGDVSVPDVVIAVLLSAIPVAVATGALQVEKKYPGAAACLGVIGLTIPVAWRRPLPLTAAAVMAVAAAANGLAFGHLVRCGVALPAVYIVAFGIAARVSWPRAAAGLALCTADVVVEGYYDPQIGWSGLGFVLALLLAFVLLGCLLRARNRTAEALRAKSIELRQQREQTARLAVLADRAQLSADDRSRPCTTSSVSSPAPPPPGSVRRPTRRRLPRRWPRSSGTAKAAGQSSGRW